MKKVFRINNKIIVEGGVYHITQRAPGTEKLFLEDSDYLYFLHLLKEVSSRYAVEIYSFVLMPNHVHILLKIRDVNLSEAMKKLYQRYAVYFNIKYQRKGHVFSGIYRASLCKSDFYLLAISLYIHLNPVKAGIVQRAQDYRWSSLLVYSDGKKSKFVSSDMIFNILSKEKVTAKSYYQDLVERGYKFEYENCFKSKRWLFSFAEGLKKSLLGFSELRSKEARDFLELEKKIAEVKLTKRARKPQDMAAKKYLIQQLVSTGYCREEIIFKTGLSRQTIYEILNKSS
ncbi:MAG: transposase [Candidatus Omnitrophica bacterium]|nr:transposase [Candidatus Omnitrophota bacterium]MDD5429586.1 transposase [Candidatus Omnitrophota bacterium]